MAIVEAISIPIGVTGQQSVDSAANSYEDLGDAVAKTQLEAEKLAQQFGINDKRTQEAIKVAGKYKQQMEELDFAIDGARGGVDQLFRATQGVAAGFELAAGATALFGSESEELQVILTKVQGAMVFSQGLRDLKEFAPAMLSAARATREWFLSLTLVQKAFLSLGIGLVVDLIYQLYSQYKDVSEISKEAALNQKKYNDQVRDLREEITKLGETQRETIVRNLEEYEQQYIEVQKELHYLYEQLRYQETELEKKEHEERINNTVLAGIKITLERKRLQKQLKEIDDKAAADALANQQKVNKSKQDELDLQKKINQERAKTSAEMAEFIKKQEEVTSQNIENVTKTNQATLDNLNVTLNTIDERQKSSIELAKLFIGAYGEDLKNTFSQALYAIDDISQSFAGNDEERQKKAFDLSKKLAIVQTTIATIESTVQAYKEAQKNPLNQITAGAYAISQAAIAAAFGLAQVQQIRNQQFTGGTRPSVQGGGGGAGQAVPRFNAPSTRLPGGGEEFSQVRRVYVTERDITNVQEKVKVTEKLSQF